MLEDDLRLRALPRFSLKYVSIAPALTLESKTLPDQIYVESGISAMYFVFL